MDHQCRSSQLRRVAPVYLILILCFAIPGRSLACSCMQQTDQQATDSADVVFIGKVVGVRSDTGLYGLKRRLTTFEVHESLKGELGKLVVVSSPMSGATCGYAFQESKHYRVFANLRDGHYATSLCSGNRGVERPKES